MARRPPGARSERHRRRVREVRSTTTCLSRRQVLRAASLGVVGVAGCASRGQTDSGTASEATTTEPAEATVTLLSAAEIERDDPPVTFGVSVTDETLRSESPATLTLSLRNTSAETTVPLRGGPIFPFGVLLAESVSSDGRFLLWNERYAETSAVRIENGTVSVAARGRLGELKPGEQVSARYAVRRQEQRGHTGRFRVVDHSGVIPTYAGLTPEIELSIADREA